MKNFTISLILKDSSEDYWASGSSNLRYNTI